METHENIHEPVKGDGDYMIIKCVEFMDASNYQAFEDAIKHCIFKGNPRIVLDFSELKYLSSAPANIIVGSIDKTRKAGGDIVIFQPFEAVQDVIDLLGLSTVMTVAWEEAAVARYFEDLSKQAESETEENES